LLPTELFEMPQPLIPNHHTLKQIRLFRIDPIPVFHNDPRLPLLTAIGLNLQPLQIFNLYWHYILLILENQKGVFHVIDIPLVAVAFLNVDFLGWTLIPAR
jgi:hypothetical protein